MQKEETDSGAKALGGSVGFVRGLKPPPPSVSRLPASNEAVPFQSAGEPAFDSLFPIADSLRSDL
jgi:hypothetical protein